MIYYFMQVIHKEISLAWSNRAAKDHGQKPRYFPHWHLQCVGSVFGVMTLGCPLMDVR